MPAAFPILYLQDFRDRVEVRRTAGETPFSKCDLVMRFPVCREGERFAAVALGGQGSPIGMIADTGERGFEILAAGAARQRLGMVDPQPEVIVAFPAGPSAVIVGRVARQRPAHLLLIRRGETPVVVPDLGVNPDGVSPFAGGFLFRSVADGCLILWRPGASPSLAFQGTLDGVWAGNKVALRKGTVHRLAWDGRRFRLKQTMAQLPAGAYATPETEVGRFILIRLEASNASDRPQLFLMDAKSGTTRTVALPAGTVSVASSSAREILVRSVHGPAVDLRHRAVDPYLSKFAVPGPLLAEKGYWGEDWWTLDPERSSKGWKHVRKFRSNGSHAIWP